MLRQHTLEKLHALRLTGMAAAFEQQLAQPAAQDGFYPRNLALFSRQPASLLAFCRFMFFTL